MKTQEMHDKFLANMIKLTGKTAAELVPGIHKAGVEAHAAGDGAVNDARAAFFADVAAELGVAVEAISKYAEDLKDDWPAAKVNIAKETGKSEDEVRGVLHEVGNKHMDAYKSAVAANHQGFVERVAKELGYDEDLINKAFIFD